MREETNIKKYSCKKILDNIVSKINILFNNKFLYLSIFISLFISFLFYFSSVNEKLKNFTKFGLPEVLASSSLFVSLTLMLYFKFPKTKKIAYFISFYSLSASIFSFFLMNVFKQYIDIKTDMYFHYITRFTFDLMLYLCSCSILELEIKNSKFFKNLFYLHLIAIIIFITTYVMSFFYPFSLIFNTNTPVYITKHLLFPIKFIPYIFGIYYTYKKIKQSKNYIFFTLLTSFIVGLFGQVYDELMYFSVIEKNTYSVHYYPYLFLISFIIILNKYNSIIIDNINLYKLRYDDISSLISHESYKSLSDIITCYNELYESLENTNTNLDYRSIDNKFNQSMDMIFYYIKSINDIKKFFDYINPEKIDIHSLTKNAINLVEDRGRNRTKIKYVYNDEEKLFIISDKKKLLIAIENIISNAYDHSNQDELVYVNIFRNENHVTIDIENNGEIKEENLSLLFKYQFTTRRFESSNHGFGLRIAKESLNVIGCHIKLKKRTDPVIFSITIPFSLSEDVKKTKW